MLVQALGTIGILFHVVPVGMAIAEQHMHHRARQRAVGAGLEREMDIGDLGRARPIRIDHHQLGATPLARLLDMAHRIDLGRRRIAAPDDDQIRYRHLAWIGTAYRADPGVPPRPGERRTHRRMLAGIAHRVAQTVDPVALYLSHRAGVEIRPYRLRAVRLRRGDEGFRDLVERRVPRNTLQLAARFAAQRMGQPIGMMHSLGIARHLGAHHAVGVVVVACAAHPADGARVQPLDFERAGARAIMRADRGDDFERGVGIHGNRSLT